MDVMDSLFCDEVMCFSTPTTTTHDRNHATIQYISEPFTCVNSFYSTKEDCEHAFVVSMQKDEPNYAAQDGNFDCLVTYNLIIPRFRVMQWLIKSRSRLNFSFETLLSAANCLDRFMSMKQPHKWEFWMVELLSVACLSVTSKLLETSTINLNLIQMEHMEHTFESSTIQRMELMLLSALKWQPGSSTAYSYVEILLNWLNNSFKPHLHNDLTSQVNELLVGTLLDYKFLEFRPWVIAVSAIKCSMEKLLLSKADIYLPDISALIPFDQQGGVMKCQKRMLLLTIDPFHKLTHCGESYYFPSSPVTELFLPRRIEISDRHVDLSVFEKPNNIKSSQNKRKREQQ